MEWVTTRENLRRGAVLARKVRALLTDEQVKNVQQKLRSGQRASSIAREYMVSKGVISNIKLRKTYLHVTNGL
jgi:hypothetical protein